MSRDGSHRIAVVFSNGPAINEGRSTEHLGFCALARRHGLHGVTFFDLLPFSEYGLYQNRFRESFTKEAPRIRTYYEDFPIEYKRLLGNLQDLKNSDAIIFWSGWLHTPLLYSHYETVLVEMGFARNKREATDLIDSHLYFDNEDSDIFERTLSFGETVLSNTVSQEISPGYGRAYRNFFKEAAHVYMRDMVSAQKISRLRLDYDNSHLGADCATFLSEDDIDHLPGDGSGVQVGFCRGKMALFFGRSDIDPTMIRRLAEYLGDRLNKTAFSFSWGTEFSFPQLKSLPFPTPPVTPGSNQLKIGDTLRLIRASSIVVTDTYHVCVNSWAMGVPAICVGSVLSKEQFDRNSGTRFSSIDKRYVFYSMCDALDFYLHEQELSDTEYLLSHLRHVGDLIEEGPVVDRVIANIRKNAADAEARLVQSLGQLLSSR